jgi:hypothetical protein
MEDHMNFKSPFVATTLFVIVLLVIGFTSYLGAHSGSPILVHIYHPTLFVASGFTTLTDGFVQPTGTDWPAGEDVEILVTGEPERDENGGFGGTTTTWRSLGTIKADPNWGGFGYAPETKFPVTRNICGFPPQELSKPLFLAKNTDYHLTAFASSDNSIWFTFKACPNK